MKIEELLKQQGLMDEQISKITSSMKENKIYTTAEENIEIRYQKLKEQKEDADKQLKTANETLEELKKGNKNNEELQGKVQEYETSIENMKKEFEANDLNSAIELELVKLGVHSTKAAKAELDVSKIKKNTDGTITGLTEQTASWKTDKQWLLKTGEKQAQYSPQAGTTASIDLQTQIKSKDFNFTEFLKQKANEKGEIS